MMATTYKKGRKVGQSDTPMIQGFRVSRLMSRLFPESDKNRDRSARTPRSALDCAGVLSDQCHERGGRGLIMAVFSVARFLVV